MKNFKERLYLYYPLLFLLLLFLVDKVFTLPFFKKEFLQTGNVVYYRHRELLFEKLQKNKDQIQKLVVAFGDSRAYPYSALGLSPERKKEYTVYNFSAPQALPAYTLFWLDRFKEKSLHPELIILVVSPEAFDDAKKLMHVPFLRLGADDAFVQKYGSWISEADRDEYNLDKLMVFRSLDFNYKLFYTRLSTGKLDEYTLANNSELPILNLYNGEQLAYMTLMNNEEKLKKEALRMKNVYLTGYKIYDTQFLFTEEALVRAKEMNSKVILVFPKIYKDYYDSFMKLNFQELVVNRLKAIAEKHGMDFVDLNKESDCDLFYDASHQSVKCFDKQINYLIDIHEKKLPQK